MTKEQPPNVILFVLDTARAKDFSIYNDSISTTTPFFDEFAADNLLYDQCITEAPWTLPAHTSLFTGKYPSQHGVNSWQDRLPDSVDTLAAELQRSGYQTIGITNNSWVSDLFGLARGFDDFYRLWQIIQSDNDLMKASRDSKELSHSQTLKRLFLDTILKGNPFVNFANGLYGKFLHNRSDHGASRTNNIIKEWIRKDWDREKPFFLFANYLEPHMDYDPPKEYAEKFLSTDYASAMSIPQEPITHMFGEEQNTDSELSTLRELYQAEIHYLDSKLNQIYQFLNEEGALENTLMILVGDHGENIGEFDLLGHFYSLTESLLRVPCAAQLPSRTSKNINKPIQLTDIYELIREVTLDETPINQNDGIPSTVRACDNNITISELLGVNPPKRAVNRRTSNRYDSDKFERLSCEQIASRSLSSKVVRKGNKNIAFTLNAHNELESDSIDPELEQALNDWISMTNETVAESTEELDIGTEERLRDLGYL